MFPIIGFTGGVIMAQINSLISEVKTGINRDRKQMFEFLEDWWGKNDKEVREDLAPMVEELKTILGLEGVFEALDQLAGKLDSQEGVRAVMLTGILSQQFDILNARVEMLASIGKIKNAARNAWNRLKGFVQSFLQSVSTHIWNMLSQFVTPKGWSIAGSVGVTFPGLSGNLQLQINF
jgi:hypothetical protein